MQFVGPSGLLCSYSLGCRIMLWDTLKKSWEMRPGTQLSGINNYQYKARRSCLTFKCKYLNMGYLTLQDQSNANSKEECKGKTSSLFVNGRCRGC